MIKIGIADWILARSDAFKLLMIKLRDHIINTKVSFSKVKAKHHDFQDTLESHESRIKKLERVINSLEEVPEIKIRRKRNGD